MSPNREMKSAEHLEDSQGDYGQKTLGTTHCSMSLHSERSLFTSIELYPKNDCGIS